MTSKPSEQEENILPVKKTEPIHFLDENGQRVLVQCLVLEETEITDTFLLEAVNELPTLVITKVEPSENDEESVTLTFRGLSNIEVLERIGAGILPAYMLEAFFPNTEDIIREEAEEAMGGKENLEEADSQTLSMLKIGLLISHHNELPDVTGGVEYKATVPLAATHLAQIVNIATGGPAFAVMTTSMFNAYKRRKVVNRPLTSDLTTLSFPIYGSGDFVSATEVLRQKITGHYLISPTKETEHKVRGDLLALIVGLASGSKDALVKTFRLLNPTTKAIDMINQRSAGDFTITPTSEQIETVVMNEIVDQTYRMFTADTLSQIIPSTTPSSLEAPQLISDDDTEMLRKMFETSGLDKFFETLNVDEDAKPLPIPEPDAGLDEILDYFADRITLDSFPETMEALKAYIHFPALFEYDWAEGEEASEESHPLASGAVLVAKIFTLAIRFARLQKLTLETELPINPIAVLVQILSGNNEASMWALEETIRRLPRSADGVKLFSQVLTSGLIHPKIAAGSLSVDFLIRSLVPTLLHRTGHIILQEEWKHEEIMNILPPYSLLTPFVDRLFEDDENDENCGAFVAAVEALTAVDFQKQGVEIVEELGILLVELANIKATEELPEAEAKDPNYKTYLENYLVTQLLYNGMI